MKSLLMVTALAFVGGTAAHALPNKADVYPAVGGPIRITPIYHASMQIEFGGKVIQVDPFSAGDYTGAKKADIILITHTHPDHFDVKAMAKVEKKSTRYILPLAYDDMRASAPGVPDEQAELVQNFDSVKVDGINIESVPAYNLVRGPKPGQKFHPKSQFNGYVLTLGGKRIYIAGDTEATPEMKRLKKIDIAFLPMNLPFTMTPQEAAKAAKAFKPKVVYPYHFRYPFNKANQNPQQFAAALKGSGITVKMGDWYGHPAK